MLLVSMNILSIDANSSFQRNISDSAQKMKFSIKDFFSKYDQPLFLGDLITFTEEILNGKLHS